MLGFTALAIIILAVGMFLRSRPRTTPSIIFILIDTLRADYLGTYGFPRNVSPAIDRFAAQSVVFENAFAQAPWTKPSVASIFTSFHPEQHGVLTHRGRYGDPSAPTDETDVLPEEALTLAECLHAAGYATAAVVANPWILRELGFAQGFETFLELGRRGTPARAILRAGRTWLARRHDSRPFFLYLHLMDVHGPYNAPDEDFEAVRPSSGAEEHELSPSELAAFQPYLLLAPWVQGPGGHTLETWRARYAAGVHHVDREIGVFLDEIEHTQPLDRTMIVVTSDHGEELAEHGRWGHGYRLYDEQLHVPLILRLPRSDSSGRRIGSIVNLIDLMPTILASAGAPIPPHLAGRDLSPLFTGRQERAGEVTFASGVAWHPELRSVRTEQHKLIIDGRSGSRSLFDLVHDPGETSDVARENAPVVADLERALAAHESLIASGPHLDASTAGVSQKLRERLEALGYAH